MRLSQGSWRGIAGGGLAWFLASLTLFLIGIEQPAKPNFDEFHYVPAAKQFLEWNEARNLEHPPLGKELMAAGMAVLGDGPLGWRAMSAVFGALTLVAVYAWAVALFGAAPWVAHWVAGVTLANQLLYVQARIGMLDTFMFAFLAAAFALFTRAWMRDDAPPAEQRRVIAAAGACFGLASAAKWAALVPWAACSGLVLAVALLRRWGTRFEAATERPRDEAEFYGVGLWPGLRARDWWLGLGVVGAAAYLLPFLAYLFLDSPRGERYGLGDLLGLQREMWSSQLRVVQDHPYMSHWLDWASLKRPIWYAFDREEGDRVRSVILLGNPLVMWAGVLAWVYAGWIWLSERSRPAFLVFFAYAVLYLGWAIIPRKVSFYYYYYPAGTTLSLVLGYVVWRVRGSATGRAAAWTFLIAAVALFAYFFPILSAQSLPAGAFKRWMWFPGWI